ncbi:MAG: C40 family peptidase [Clostridia bacterium]|nr:C40 family peptidase [Clostridia bacterium]
MKIFLRAASAALALIATVTVAGCAAADGTDIEEDVGVVAPLPDLGDPDFPETDIPETEAPPAAEPEIPEVPEPTVNTVSYILLNTSGVNIRSGAGTGYAVRGAAEKSTMYAMNGVSGNWYQTAYKNSSAYIYSDYCEVVEMQPSDDERIERVIAEGTKLLGVPYVYGAPRYHNGNGVLASNFDINKFDCSSLMQYIFSKGAGINLQMTSRSQALYGTEVSKANLQRGDLMFFTNSTRYNYSGIERIGHVALYLGGNWILHTASDYAKIEQISATRWSYFITAKRMF